MTENTNANSATDTMTETPVAETADTAAVVDTPVTVSGEAATAVPAISEPTNGTSRVAIFGSAAIIIAAVIAMFAYNNDVTGTIIADGSGEVAEAVANEPQVPAVAAETGVTLEVTDVLANPLLTDENATTTPVTNTVSDVVAEVVVEVVPVVVDVVEVTTETTE